MIKKTLFFLMVLAVLATTLGYRVGSVSAAPLGVIVYSEAFEDQKPGKHVSGMFWADSDWHEVYCVTTDEPGYVSCQFPEKYAGQYLTLLLNDSLFFYVKVPTRHPKGEPTNPALTCTNPEVPGADVEFTLEDSSTVTYFLSGNTLAEVAANADDWVLLSGGYYASYNIVSGLYCGQEPS